MPGWVIGLIVTACAIPVVIFMIGLFAAIAVPSFINARTRSQTAACQNNLRSLDTAKQLAVLDHGYKAGDVIPETEITNNLHRAIHSLICPAGGSYTPGTVDEEPACSVHGTLSDAGRGSSRNSPDVEKTGTPER